MTVLFLKNQRANWHVYLFLYVLQLPPAPPPPPFPEGYAPPRTAEGENDSEAQQAAESQVPTVDPIIDQGPSKRMKV